MYKIVNLITSDDTRTINNLAIYLHKAFKVRNTDIFAGNNYILRKYNFQIIICVRKLHFLANDHIPFSVFFVIESFAAILFFFLKILSSLCITVRALT